jgi:uncharacterized membrane protein
MLIDLIGYIGYAVEAFGVVLIVMGACIAVVRHGCASVISTGGDAYHEFRRIMGRAMMVGLEFLVAGDIIRTVVASHTLKGIAVLGMVVLIRTVLVFTIHLELEGRWPWQRPEPETDGTTSDNPAG